MTDVPTAARPQAATGATVRADDAAEFARLVERHGPELRAHCYRILGSHAEAEDMTQETFMRAWDNRTRFEGRASARTWLYRIATNACVDALRRRAHPVGSAVPLDGLDAEGVTLPAEVASREREPGAAVAARETVELALDRIIDRLPARQRAVLILRDVFGWTAEASASQLDTSVAAANSALQRARATMAAHRPADDAAFTAAPRGRTGRRDVLDSLVEACEQAEGATVARLALAAR